MNLQECSLQQGTTGKDVATVHRAVAAESRNPNNELASALIRTTTLTAIQQFERHDKTYDHHHRPATAVSENAQFPPASIVFGSVCSAVRVRRRQWIEHSADRRGAISSRRISPASERGYYVSAVTYAYIAAVQ